MNYIDEIAHDIANAAGEPDPWSRPGFEQALFRAYAVLALSKGPEVTNADVHDAWVAWRLDCMDRDGRIRSRHLVPYEDLEPEIQTLDTRYTAAIQTVAIARGLGRVQCECVEATLEEITNATLTVTVEMDDDFRDAIEQVKAGLSQLTPEDLLVVDPFAHTNAAISEAIANWPAGVPNFPEPAKPPYANRTGHMGPTPPMPTKRVPSISRDMHYVSYGTPGGEYEPAHRAAKVTAVNDDGTVALFVMNPTGTFHNAHVVIDDETKAPGTCHWPEFVPGG